MDTHVYRTDLKPTELAKELHQLVATRRQSLWLVCRYLADLADSGGYKLLPYPDVYAFAWRELGMPVRRTRERVRVGRALRVLPEVEACFVRGDLGFARVREIVRVATPETEEAWLQAALTLPRRCLEAMVARAAGDPGSGSEASGAPDEGVVTLRLPAATWRRMEAALAAARTAEGADLSPEAALEVLVIEGYRALARSVPNLGDGSAPDAEPRPDAADDPVGSPDGTGPRVDHASTPSRRGEAARPDKAASPVDGDPTGSQPLSRAARRLLSALTSQLIASADQLGRATGIPGGSLAAGLAELEVYGLVERFGGMFRLSLSQASGDESAW